jgi:cell division protein FtsA
MEDIVVGIDVGTTKVCTLVARVEEDDSLRIMGVGIEPSDGIRKGVIVDLSAASQSIARSVAQAEQTSGLKIDSALVSLAGAHVASVNSRGVVAVSGHTVEESDVERAMDSARSVAIPNSREVIHVIQRGFAWMVKTAFTSPLACTATAWKWKRMS